MPKEQNKRTLVKLLKISGFGLAILLLIVVGLFIWLRTSSGARFVESRINSALADQGLSLTTGQFSGPLPSRLLIRDAVLADADGPLIKTGLIEVQLAPLALLRGLAHLPLVKVVDPEIIRLPVTGGDKSDESAGGFTLPVCVRLDKLEITGGLVQAGALSSLGLQTPALSLDADGLARLENKNAALQLKVRAADSTGLEILGADIDFGNEPQADRLNLSIKMDDRPGGLLSGLLNDPDWPGLELTLAGSGLMNDWRGRLELAAGDLGALKADLAFAGASGRLWADIMGQPIWQAEIKTNVVPGDRLANIAELLGSDIKVNLFGGRDGQDLNGEMLIEGNEDSAVSMTTKLEGTLTGEGGDFRLAAALRGLLPPNTSDESANNADDLNVTADLALNSRFQKIENAVISGPGLNITGSALHQLDDGVITGKMELAIDDGSPLLSRGLNLAGLEAEAFGGAVNLSADLNWRGASEPASGQLVLEGQNLRWPSEALTDFLGTTLTLHANLTGGGGRPFIADVQKAAAGHLSLSGRASYSPDERPSHSAFEADIAAEVTDLAPLAAGLSGPLTLAVKGQGRLNDFRASADLSSPQITAAPGAIDGPELRLTAAGSLFEEKDETTLSPALSGQLELTASDSPGGPLNLSTDWNFYQTGDGFRAAVKNLAGDLAGLVLTGDLMAEADAAFPKLTGFLTAEVSGWDKLSALTGQPLSGSPAKLSIDLTLPDGRQSVKANAEIPSLKLGQGADQVLALNQTSLALTADDLFGAPNMNLDLQLGAGLSGPFSWGSGNVKAIGQSGAGNIDARLNQAKLAGSGGSAQDGLQLSGAYNLNDSSFQLNALDFRLAGGGLQLKEPLHLSWDKNLKIGSLSLGFLPAGQMTAEADLTPGAMKVKADLQDLPYRFFKSFGLEAPDGTVNSLTIDLAQSDNGPAGDFQLKTQVAPTELKGLKPSLEINGRLSGGSRPELTVAGLIDGGPGWEATGRINLRLPLTPGTDGGLPTVNANAALSGDFNFTGPITPLWTIAGQPDRFLSGQAEIRAEIAGTMTNPTPRGTAYLGGGCYEDRVLGLVVSDITLEAHSTPEQALTAILSAKDGRGGGLALEAKIADFRNPSLSAKGRLSRFNPLHRDDVVVYISGDLGAEGPLDRLSLTSGLTVEQGELDLKIAMARGSIPTLNIGGEDSDTVSPRGGHRLALKVDIPRKFFIRGYGLESEWRGSLSVNGSTNRPSLVGFLAPERGYFEIFSKQFELSGGDISFNGGTIPNLNLELTNNGPNITALLRIGGTATKPQLSFSSRPPLPQEEVLSQVLFGKSTTSISRFEALQLARAINEVRNFGEEGFNAVGLIRESLGLDVLRLGGVNNDRERRASDLSGSLAQDVAGGSAGSGQSDDISVEAGKYIGDNIYVGVEHSGMGGSAVRLEVELKPNISLEGRTSTESSRIGLGWKKDY